MTTATPLPELEPLQALFAAGRHADAADGAARLTALRPELAAAWRLRGVAERLAGRDERGSLEKAAAMLPDDGEIHYYLGEARRRCGDLAGAADSFAAVTRINPGFFGAYVNLGIVLAAQNRYREAEDSYARALALQPGSHETYYNLALALRHQQRLDEAIACFERALAIQPNLPDALGNLASTLIEGARLAEAENAFRRLLALRPESVPALRGLALLLLKNGRDDEAEALLARAIGVSPELRELHAERAAILRRLGRHDESLAEFVEAYRPDWGWRDKLTELSRRWVVLDGLQTGREPAASRPATTARLVAPPAPVARAAAAVDAPDASAPGQKLRIVLIYPPPWRIAGEGETDEDGPYAPPPDAAGLLGDGDFHTLPYGLLTLAAEARRAGHRVDVLNLSLTPWTRLVALLKEHPAELFGLSAVTASRRGLDAVSGLIRTLYPAAHITAGGPFVSAVPEATLRHYRALDSVVIGEGEATFMELIDRLAAGRSTAGIAGTAGRLGDEIVMAPRRPRIRDIDTLASPFDHFDSYVVMTSRGCPSDCSFCGSSVIWERKLRFHSVERSIEMMTRALARLPLPFLAVKDDTFTAHRRRALAICDQIVARRLNFVWSCDTRVDCLDEELLLKMRLAGCQRISLGVESGSPRILETIDKKTTPEAILAVNAAARKLGFQVRFYMMLGNRGETADTVRESIELIKAARPGAVFFSYLGFSPGTREWEILRRQENLGDDFFFANNFRDFSVASGRQGDWSEVNTRIHCEIGRFGFDYDTREREAVAALLPDTSAVQLELAQALRRDGRLDEAEGALDRAEALGFPIAELIDNQRACLALARGDVPSARRRLEGAFGRLPNAVLHSNLALLQNTRATPGGRPPQLDDTVQAADFRPFSAATVMT